MHYTESTDVIEALMSMADSHHADVLRRFFKTGKGDYGEGDIFVGLKNPQVRLVVKEAWRDISLQETVKLVKNPIHEVRLCGLLILVEKYLNALKSLSRSPNDPSRAQAVMTEIYETYLSLHPYINNWDLVDLSAIKIVGNHECLLQSFDLMDRWILPTHTLWQRRISMVSTWMLIRRGMPEVALRRAALLLDNQHDLLNKAAGWMLREVWKRGYKEELRTFLRDNVSRMPAIMLSYACEQMPLTERHHWQSLRRGI